MANFVKVDGATTWTVYDDGSITAVVEESEGSSYISDSVFYLVKAEDIADYDNMIIYIPEDNKPYKLLLSGMPNGFWVDPYNNSIKVTGYKGDAMQWVSEPPVEDSFELSDIGEGDETELITGPITIMEAYCELTTLPDSTITMVPSLKAHYANDETPEINTVTLSYRQGRL